MITTLLYMSGAGKEMPVETWHILVYLLADRMLSIASHVPLNILIKGVKMNIRYEIKDWKDIEISVDGTELEILFTHDNFGNHYVDVPIELIKKHLKDEGLT